MSEVIEKPSISNEDAAEILKAMMMRHPIKDRLSPSERQALEFAVQTLNRPISPSMIDINSAYLRGYNQGRKAAGLE
jgi:hypothetical protein